MKHPLSRLGLAQVDLGELEGQYRRAHFRQDYLLAMAGLAIFAASTALLSVNDFQFIGPTPTAFALLAGRIALIAWTIWLAVTFRRGDDYARFDRCLVWCGLFGVTLVAVMRLTRPLDYLHNFAAEAAFALILFLMFRMRRPWLALAPTYLGLSGLLTLWFWKTSPSLPPLVAISLSLVVAMAGGYAMACWAENLRRRQFLTQRAEAQARRQLERTVEDLRQAQAEVRALSGLLPICANCKKIRDDSGYWQQIESYISAHTQAQFTHGLCPECIAKLYPQLGRGKAGADKKN